MTRVLERPLELEEIYSDSDLDELKLSFQYFMEEDFRAALLQAQEEIWRETTEKPAKGDGDKGDAQILYKTVTNNSTCTGSNVGIVHYVNNLLEAPRNDQDYSKSKYSTNQDHDLTPAKQRFSRSSALEAVNQNGLNQKADHGKLQDMKVIEDDVLRLISDQEVKGTLEAVNAATATVFEAIEVKLRSKDIALDPQEQAKSSRRTKEYDVRFGRSLYQGFQEYTKASNQYKRWLQSTQDRRVKGAKGGKSKANLDQIEQLRLFILRLLRWCQNNLSSLVSSIRLKDSANHQQVFPAKFDRFLLLLSNTAALLSSIAGHVTGLTSAAGSWCAQSQIFSGNIRQLENGYTTGRPNCQTLNTSTDIASPNKRYRNDRLQVGSGGANPDVANCSERFMAIEGTNSHVNQSAAADESSLGRVLTKSLIESYFGPADQSFQEAQSAVEVPSGAQDMSHADLTSSDRQDDRLRSVEESTARNRLQHHDSEERRQIRTISFDDDQETANITSSIGNTELRNQNQAAKRSWSTVKSPSQDELRRLSEQLCKVTCRPRSPDFEKLLQRIHNLEVLAVTSKPAEEFTRINSQQISGKKTNIDVDHYISPEKETASSSVLFQLKLKNLDQALTRLHLIESDFSIMKKKYANNQ